MKINDKEYEEIIPTAMRVLYPMQFTDIPLVKETIDFLRAKNVQDMGTDKNLTIQLEGRHKLIDYLVKKEGITQVLELASGWLFKGVEYCKNPEVKFIEIDFPQIIELKKEFLGKNKPINNILLSGNALNDYDFCDKYFDPNKPVAIINQGLLRYLTMEEKTIVANNVKKLLQKYGGCWVTCDFTTKGFDKRKPNFESHKENMLLFTSRYMLPKHKDNKEVKEFLGNLGFDVEIHDFTESEPLLFSPKSLGISKEQTIEFLKGATVCVIKLK